VPARLLFIGPVKPSATNAVIALLATLFTLVM
jgi:hypothetical protein